MLPDPQEALGKGRLSSGQSRRASRKSLLRRKQRPGSGTEPRSANEPGPEPGWTQVLRLSHRSTDPSSLSQSHSVYPRGLCKCPLPVWSRQLRQAAPQASAMHVFAPRTGLSLTSCRYGARSLTRSLAPSLGTDQMTGSNAPSPAPCIPAYEQSRFSGLVPVPSSAPDLSRPKLGNKGGVGTKGWGDVIR